MKKQLVLIGTVLLLAGCAKQPVSPIKENTEATKRQIESVRKSLPTECATPGILSQLTALEQQVDANDRACLVAVEKERINSEKQAAYKWLMALLLIISLGFIGYKLVRK